ncbi:hypothetical protein HZC21_05085 [Candidatus Peregrinibacteria bacterium]|nr:hypothetical protein [Candidatus Peregrinibacteria bacterium]
MALFYCIARKPEQKDQFIYEVEKGGAAPSGAGNVEKQAGVDASKAAESTKQKGADVARAQQEKLAQMSELGKEAQEAAETVDATETLDEEGATSKSTGFPEAEKLQTEVINYNKRTQELYTSGREISVSIVNFQKAYQRFEAGKKEWSVFLRGSPLVDDDETEQLNHQLQILKRALAQKMQALRAKQHQLEEEGKDLVEEGQELRKQKEEEKNKKLGEVDAQGAEIDKTKKKNEGQYSALEVQQKKLYGEREKLKKYRDGLEQQSSAAAQSGEEIKVKEEQVREFQGNLDESIKTLDEALAKNPPSPQKEALLAKREELLKHREEASGGMKELADTKEKTLAASAEIQGQLSSVSESEMNINDHLDRRVNPSLSALDRSIQELEIAKLKNGTQKEQIEGEYMEILAAVDEMNMGVIENVAANTGANKELIDALDQQVGSLNAINIERPDVWDASIGLLFNKIGEGAVLLTRELICQSILDPISRFIKRTTKDIPVINVIAEVAANIIIDLPSGVIEGVGELVGGISVMVARPLEALKGIAALAGRNPQTGEWSFSQAGDTWKELGKVLIAYENFEKGQWGKGVGKVALNVLLTATGAGAAAKGAQGASIAYAIARAGGAGVMKAGLKAAGTGAGIFAGEFTGGLSKLPGEALSGAGKLLKAPAKLVERLRLDKAARLGRQVAETEKALGKVEAAVSNMAKEGKVPEGLAGKTASELDKISPAELVKAGIKTQKQIRDFLKYREAVKTVEMLEAAADNAGVVFRLAQIDPEFSKLPSLKGKALDRFVERFNKEHPEGLKTASKYQDATQIGDEIVAFDKTGKLKRFKSYDEYTAEYDAFTRQEIQKVENMAAVTEKAQAIPAEDLRNLSVDEIYARATDGVSLSEGQARLVRTRITQFKEDMQFADSVGVMDHEAQVAFVDDMFKKRAAFGSEEDIAELAVDHPESIRIMTGQGGMPSSVVIIMDNKDFLKFLEHEKKPWSVLSDEERIGLLEKGGGIRGVSVNYPRHNVIVMPASTIEDVSGYASTLRHELTHYHNKLFELHGRSWISYSTMSRAVETGLSARYMEKLLAKDLIRVRDEILAFLTDPTHLRSPQELSYRFGPGGNYARVPDKGVNELLGFARRRNMSLGKTVIDKARQLESNLQNRYGQIIDCGLRAAEGILKYPRGYEMMRLTPIEHWPRLLEHLRAAG